MADHPPHRPAGRRALKAAALALAAIAGAVGFAATRVAVTETDPDAEWSAPGFEELLQVKGGRYAGHEPLQRYVSAIGEQLARFSSQPELPYEFVVVNAPDVNAWAMPGGQIGIHRGLLLALDNEAELAAVLAHEIAHAAEKHATEPLPGQTGISVSAILLGDAGRAFEAQKYSREKELDADEKGIRYMAQAGYHPQAAVALQKTMLARHRAEQGHVTRRAWQRMLDSHPPSVNRVNANRKSAAYLPAGKYRRAAYQRAVAPLRKTAPAYQLYESGRQALEQRRPDQALKYAAICIRLVPEESLFHELEGVAYIQSKQPERAGQSLNRAIALNGSYFRHYLMRAKWREQMGSKVGATLDYQRSIALLETEDAKEGLQRTSDKSPKARKGS